MSRRKRWGTTATRIFMKALGAEARAKGGALNRKWHRNWKRVGAGSPSETLAAVDSALEPKLALGE